MNLPDPVPLGVAGTVTIALDRFLGQTDAASASAQVLVAEDERIAYISGRLWAALDRPLTSPGSEALAHEILGHFDESGLLPRFAQKALETLRDDRPHSVVSIRQETPQLAILFVAWSGTHREMQAQRVGNYLNGLIGTGKKLTGQGLAIAGLLEIDAYLRDNAELERPERSLDELFEVDVEYSYLPGALFGGSSAGASRRLTSSIILNPDLCSPEERATLARIAGQVD